ncbi:MAG: EI24 domain-containing protein [Sphingomonadales bacterium]|nr:EI24 domain-containing protein [Sphingomonadales bacterium]
MISALFLALRQLGDPRVLRVLVKSLALTLLIVALLGAAGWWAVQQMLATSTATSGASELIAAVLVLVGMWLLWRLVAIAVLQFFADEVVEAVEARHYPAALAGARRLGWREELANGLKGAGRALLFNLIALPFALALLITGVGTALVFWAVNALLLGRELTDMVWLRHRHAADALPPISRAERLMLGGIAAALLLVPVVNLIAPILSAALAAHLIHRKGTLPDAA